MIEIKPIPAFKDNYIWIAYNVSSRQALVVDPGEAQPVLDFIAKHKLSIDAILITHHHYDHTGGLDQLLASDALGHANIPVYGPNSGKIPAINHPCAQATQFTIDWLNRTFTSLLTPGHTLDHTCFYSAEQTPWLFCGDTLFSVGCGRLFEGTAKQMNTSLNELAALPDQTLVFAAHEYTRQNIEFALKVEPNNSALLSYKAAVELLRADNKASLPSTIELEKTVNPFLRSSQSAVVKAACEYSKTTLSEGLETFTQLRAWKDAS